MKFAWTIYSLMIGLTWRALIAWARLRGLRDLAILDQRLWLVSDSAELKQVRDAYDHMVVIFCSSAGEYEQAKPVMDRLAARGVGIAVFFFSPSGVRYAKSRQEKAYYRLAPADQLHVWVEIFDLLKPQASLIVRHELWPGFLKAAARAGSVVLFDAVVNPSLEGSILKRWGYSRLLRRLEFVFLVSESDIENIEPLVPEKAFVSAIGDTKYDRVWERRLDRQTDTKKMATIFDDRFGIAKRLIVGSGWHRDIDCALEALLLWSASLEMADPWQVLIAPHDLSEAMIRWIEQAVQSRNLTSVRLSRVLDGTGQKSGVVPVVICDTLGQLSELYGVANLAFVGGGMHYRVHNVLEPACHGIPLAFGPFYQTSREACLLVELKLANIVHDGGEFFAWWRQASQDQRQGILVQEHIKSHCGASDKLMNQLESLLGVDS